MSARPASEKSAARTHLHVDYFSGFGGSFEIEVAADALPVGRNAPQQPPFL